MEISEEEKIYKISKKQNPYFQHYKQSDDGSLGTPYNQDYIEPEEQNNYIKSYNLVNNYITKLYTMLFTLLIICIIIFILYHFYVDYRNWSNVGGDFAEGMTNNICSTEEECEKVVQALGLQNGKTVSVIHHGRKLGYKGTLCLYKR